MTTIDLDTPPTIEATGLGDKFRYLKGASGRRYLFSSVDLDDLPTFRDVVVVLSEKSGSGTRQIIWVGALDGEPNDAERARRAFESWMRRAADAHIHLLAESREERRRVIDDISAA
ncbi:MAG TPA: hypothetical protein PLJ34_01940 [Hyphomicrobiales bacterium]|nr:hypothetical protein [Kaistiaceae bacterium]HQF30182.1 hypothetical protein [Hyphomicrobiales bacterium]